MEEKKYFLEEKGFDRDGYDTCLRRLHYDDRMWSCTKICWRFSGSMWCSRDAWKIMKVCWKNTADEQADDR